MSRDIMSLLVPRQRQYRLIRPLEEADRQENDGDQDTWTSD